MLTERAAPQQYEIGEESLIVLNLNKNSVPVQYVFQAQLAQLLYGRTNATAVRAALTVVGLESTALKVVRVDVEDVFWMRLLVLSQETKSVVERSFKARALTLLPMATVKRVLVETGSGMRPEASMIILEALFGKDSVPQCVVDALPAVVGAAPASTAVSDELKGDDAALLLLDHDLYVPAAESDLEEEDRSQSYTLAKR